MQRHTPRHYWLNRIITGDRPYRFCAIAVTLATRTCVRLRARQVGGLSSATITSPSAALSLSFILLDGKEDKRNGKENRQAGRQAGRQTTGPAAGPCGYTIYDYPPWAGRTAGLTPLDMELSPHKYCVARCASVKSRPPSEKGPAAPAPERNCFVLRRSTSRQQRRCLRGHETSGSVGAGVVFRGQRQGLRGWLRSCSVGAPGEDAAEAGTSVRPQ